MNYRAPGNLRSPQVVSLANPGRCQPVRKSRAFHCAKECIPTPNSEGSRIQPNLSSSLLATYY